MSRTRFPLVLDQGVPREAASQLRSLGYDCIHAAEAGMERATDQEILAFALAASAVVVTLDADFHAVLSVSAARGPSVIRLRLQGLDASAVARLVQRVLAVFEEDLAKGSLVTVKRLKTTCHRLPIGGAR